MYVIELIKDRGRQTYLETEEPVVWCMDKFLVYTYRGEAQAFIDEKKLNARVKELSIWKPLKGAQCEN